MSSEMAVDQAPSRQPENFKGLHAAFTKAIEQAFPDMNAKLLREVYDGFDGNSDHDKKSPMDQAFREMLLFRLSDDVDKVGKLVQLSVEAVRQEIVSVTIPVFLLGDIFDSVTLDKCERIFAYVEDMVEVWKEEIFFTSCKNNILRMCNDLLRRLSRAQNTVFCGRILLFLSRFFPFSERSGLNVVSEFNLDNVTEYGVDNKDLDDALEDTVEDIPIKIDYNLYCKFWSLQDFFRNPNQCYSKASWKMFQAHSTTILDAFASFKLEDPQLSVRKELDNDNEQESDAVDVVMKSLDEEESPVKGGSGKSDNFFAKFLTNPKLLALQLSDSNFRRSVLVQFLILFQYLRTTVKFKSEANVLTPIQEEYIKDTEARVYRLLEETPPNGKRFARTVQHMLAREEMWNNWKNEGCKEFKKPEDAAPDDEGGDSLAKPKRRRLAGHCLRDAQRNGKFFLGNDVLTRIWNYCPDNLQACKSEQRNFLPSLEEFIDNIPEKSDPTYEWRALRLLARQSPHFFSMLHSPTYKISEYLECVRKRIMKEKAEAKSAAAPDTNNSNGQFAGDSSAPTQESAEQEDVALQEQEGDGELNAEEVNVDNIEKDNPEDDHNAHSKPVTANKEQIDEISPLIGSDWKKLGKKLGFTSDELLYFETDTPDGCVAMLNNWFSEDDDASLDNLAYILEGLEIDAAAKAVKALIERLSSAKETATKDDVEELSD